MIMTFIFYISVAIITSLLFTAYKRSENRFLRLIFSILTVSIPAIVAGYRYGIGTDYFTYLEILNGNFIRSDFEPIFELIVSFSRSMPNSSFVYFFMMNFITNLFIFLGLKFYENKINTSFSVFLYLISFYLVSYNASRQLMGIAIVFYSFQYILRKDFIRFIFWTIIATMCHVTAIIILPFYFIINFRGLKKLSLDLKFLFIFILIFFVMLNLDLIVQFITSLFLSNNYYASYFVKDGLKNVSFLGIIRNLVLISLGIFLFGKRMYSLNEVKIFLLYCSGMIIDLSGSFYLNPTVQRAAFPLSISYLVYVPILLKKANDRNEKIIKIFIITYILMEYTFDYFIMGYNNVVPYRWN
ncbi:EpsG family protein [Aerococcus tenax]|uniref:EpsG family protein n=1 Tax=Aerococcus tenax TaxID=3078812 RepID=UPI0018A70490|nr:EpsG family protein [Aerococcus tenax]